MIAPAGHFLTILALAAALAGCALSITGARSGNPMACLWGRRSAFAVFALVAAAVGLMEYALISHDFSVKYVADVGSRETPLYFTVISLWAALEGSILFWVFLLSVYTVAFLRIYRRRLSELQANVTGVLLAVSSFFLLVTVGPGNPFATVSPVPADGPGPNPLLQNHPMMGLHPPLLYLGFVGLSVPFAIAIASLLHGTPGPEAVRMLRRWALLPWVFLSLGIVAGMWWSYAVLGWGGYWSWDPVENASVMPWLVTTAFLHSLQVQERRHMLKTWTISLVIAAFLLSILGTFLTRSGVIESVHSFTQSAIGPFFLGFLALALVGSIGLLLARGHALSSPGTLDAVVSREMAFLVNNLLLVAITFTILLGTLFPLIAEAVQGSQLSVGAPYFNHVAVPIGFALIFLMGIGPLLPWGAGRLDDLQRRFLLPAFSGTAVIALLLVLGIRGIGSLLAFAATAFVCVATVERVLTDVRVRRSNSREGWMQGTRSLFAANPRRYGGYVVHLGVLLAVVGIVGSQSYGVRATATLHAGQSMSVDGYKLTYQGLRVRAEPNRTVLAAAITAQRGGQNLGTLLPAQNYYAGLDSQPVATPAVREEPWGLVTGLLLGKNPLPDVSQLARGRNPFEDLYLVLQAVDSQSTSQPTSSRAITLQVLVNPVVGFIWLGGATMGLGGFFALVPGRRRRRPRLAVAPEVDVSSPALAREVVAR